jgi:hypothetical protein
MGNVLIFLKDYPDERALIGEILIAYGELENSVVDLVDAVLDDNETALRALFRLRSEGQRLDVADAIVRKWITEQKLDGVYGQALGAVRRCKAIRNQYAHCTWFERHGALAFINLEDAARAPEGPVTLTARRVDLALLRKQREFFDSTEDLLVYVAESYRRNMGRASGTRGTGHPKGKSHPDLFLS